MRHSSRGAAVMKVVDRVGRTCRALVILQGLFFLGALLVHVVSSGCGSDRDCVPVTAEAAPTNEGVVLLTKATIVPETTSPPLECSGVTFAGRQFIWCTEGSYRSGLAPIDYVVDQSTCPPCTCGAGAPRTGGTDGRPAPEGTEPAR